MAAGWPALAVVLFACAAAPLLTLPAGGARAVEGGAPPQQQQQQQQPSYWCQKKECKCTITEPTDDNDQQQQVSVKCTFSGDEVRLIINNALYTYLRKFRFFESRVDRTITAVSGLGKSFEFRVQFREREIACKWCVGNRGQCR